MSDLSRYNDWIIEGRLLASAIPPDLGYLERLRDHMGIRAALNLTEDDWPDLMIEGSGMVYLHLPVDDFEPPSEEQGRQALRFIRENIAKGAVMVHCRAGLGRTGAVVGIYLVETGMRPGDAIAHVRGRRPGSLEVIEQEEFVRNWKKEGR